MFRRVMPSYARNKERRRTQQRIRVVKPRSSGGAVMFAAGGIPSSNHEQTWTRQSPVNYATIMLTATDWHGK